MRGDEWHGRKGEEYGMRQFSWGSGLYAATDSAIDSHSVAG
jgi:hypothetical protein